MSLEKEIIDYKENLEDIQHWVTLKGEIRYEKVIEFLKSNNIACTWKNLSSYMRYDKRILFNVFKYIVVLEEMYKAFVARYKEKTKTNVWNSTFAIAYSEFLKLQKDNKYGNISIQTMKKEQKSINCFRNCVVHNKILLNRKFEKKTLEEILNIFVSILPQEYRQGFVSDINGCANGLVEDSWHITINLNK